MFSPPAGAAVNVVSSGSDSGAGTFRQIVMDSLPGDIVEIPASMTVTLTASLDITKNLRIRGGGTLTGDVSVVSADYLLMVDASKVVFENIALKNMSAVLTPVYIVSEAAVNFLSCDITGNIATGKRSGPSDKQAYGGAVSISGQASAAFADCTLTSNESQRGRGGGAIYTAQGGKSSFVHCVFRENTSYGAGAGLYAFDSATVSLLGCVFDANTAGTDGGGMYVRHNSSLELANCTFTGNASGARGNTGAGAGGAMTVHQDSEATLTNCTFYGNSVNNGASVPKGGAIYTEPGSVVTLTNCTLLRNRARKTGGGIHINNGATVRLSGTILAGNSVSDIPASANLEIQGSVESLGYNLLTGGIDLASGGTLVWITTGTGSDDLAVPDANSIFGDNMPSDNGGFVPTVMISDDGRYAYNRIPADRTPLIDARGLLRPVPPATLAAAGAVEYGFPELPSAVSITGPDSILLEDSAQYRVALTPDRYRGIELWGVDPASTSSALLSGDLTNTNGTCTVEPLSAGQLRLTATVRVQGATLSATKDIAVTEPVVLPPARVLQVRPVSVDTGVETAFNVRFSRIVASAEVTITGNTSSLPAMPVAVGSPDATAGTFRATLPLEGSYLFGFEMLDFSGSRDVDSKIVEARDRPTVVVPALLSMSPTTVSVDAETQYRATFNTPLTDAQTLISLPASPDNPVELRDLSLSSDGLSGTFLTELSEAGNYLFAFTLTSPLAEGTANVAVQALATPAPEPDPEDKGSSGGCGMTGPEGFLVLAAFLPVLYRLKKRC